MSKHYAQAELTTIDQLAIMSDNELYNKLDNLVSSRNRAMAEGYNPYFVEVELCYVRREEQIRNDREDAHQAWLKNSVRE